MRCLYLANIRLPTEKAHGLQIMENCSSFVKSAALNIVLAVPRRRNKIAADSFAYYDLDRVFSIKRLWCLDLLFIPFLQWLWFIIETITFVFSAYVYGNKFKNDIDILYTREAGIAAGLGGLKPLFYEIHNLPVRPNWLYRLACRRARGIIVISEGLRNDLVKWGVPSAKILLARDGVNIDKFDISITKSEARTKLNLPDSAFIVVYTGHLYAWKGADLLAAAGQLLPAAAHIYLVGGTAGDVARFRGQYRADNIHIIGQRPQTEIPVWLKAADLLVLPNSATERISSHYTSPLKLFEYMASGTPILASDLPSIREVLDNTEAIFFAADNRDDLAERITAARGSLPHLRTNAQILRGRVKEFSWEARARLILNFIKISVV